MLPEPPTEPQTRRNTASGMRTNTCAAAPVSFAIRQQRAMERLVLMGIPLSEIFQCYRPEIGAVDLMRGETVLDSIQV